MFYNLSFLKQKYVQFTLNNLHMQWTAMR